MTLTKNQKKILSKILKEGRYNESEQNGEFTFGSQHDYASLKEKGLISFVFLEKNGKFLCIDEIRLTVKGREYISQSFFGKLWNWLNNNKLAIGVIVVILGGILTKILDLMF